MDVPPPLPTVDHDPQINHFVIFVFISKTKLPKRQIACYFPVIEKYGVCRWIKNVILPLHQVWNWSLRSWDNKISGNLKKNIVLTISHFLVWALLKVENKFWKHFDVNICIVSIRMFHFWWFESLLWTPKQYNTTQTIISLPGLFSENPTMIINQYG